MKKGTCNLDCLSLFLFITDGVGGIPTGAAIASIYSPMIFTGSSRSIVTNGMDANPGISFKYAFNLFQGNTQRMHTDSVNQLFIPRKMKNTVPVGKGLAWR